MDKQHEVKPLGAMKDADEFLTIEEISTRLKLKPSFFYAPVRRKGPDPIPCLRIGKYIRYRLPDVMAWIEKQNEARG